MLEPEAISFSLCSGWGAALSVLNLPNADVSDWLLGRDYSFVVGVPATAAERPGVVARRCTPRCPSPDTHRCRRTPIGQSSACAFECRKNLRRHTQSGHPNKSTHNESSNGQDNEVIVDPDCRKRCPWKEPDVSPGLDRYPIVINLHLRCASGASGCTGQGKR